MCTVPQVTLGFGDVLTSAQSPDTGKIIATSKSYSEEQVVVAAGPNSLYQPGDKVRLKVEMFPYEKKPGPGDVGAVKEIYPPIEKIGSVEYLYITDRHIKFKYNV